MKIISAEERLKQHSGVKMAIFGSYGIGETSLLKTLSEPTLCLDFEAGLLAVQDWPGDSISVRTWEDARDLACLIGGVNPASKSVYGQRHFDSAKGINPKDMSETAVNARQIASFAELNNLDVVIKIGIEHDKNGMYQDKNRVISIITPDHFAYAEYMTGNDIPWSV